MTDNIDTAGTGAVQPPADNGNNKASSLQKTFKNVAGIALSGSIATTGVMLFASSGFGYDQSVLSQTIDTASLFISSMFVWSAAMTAGAGGYKLGNSFEPKENTGRKWRSLSTALGMTLIAATFLVPLGERLHDSVHDGLTNTFNKPAPQAQVAPTYKAPDTNIIQPSQP